MPEVREVSPAAHSRRRGRFGGNPRGRIGLGGDCKLHAAVTAGGFGGVEMRAEGGVEGEGLWGVFGEGGVGAEGEVGGVISCMRRGVKEKVGFAEEEVVEGANGEDFGVGVVQDEALREGDFAAGETFHAGCQGSTGEEAVFMFQSDSGEGSPFAGAVRADARFAACGEGVECAEDGGGDEVGGGGRPHLYGVRCVCSYVRRCRGATGRR